MEDRDYLYTNIDMYPQNSMIYTWNIEINPKTDSIERSVYTLNEVMGNIGGMFNALLFAGIVLYSYF